MIRVGDVLGGVYQVTGLLGAGGMGQVFEAQDRSLNRRVAIKAAWPAVGLDAVRAEARLLASLEHPGLVTVHGMGSERDAHYIVMERLVGRTLADRLSEAPGKRLPIGEVLDLVIELADALTVVHRAGYAHRDLKPDNVMLTNTGRVVLMDFGIASARAAEPDRVVGSPAYVAPEVAATVARTGESHLVDIYALGVMAFEMLAGRLPFEEASIDRLLSMHMAVDPPRVSEYRAEVSVHLDRLVNEMLAKPPAARPFSMEVVAACVRAIRRGRDHGRTFSVLIVDDDDDVRELLEAAVELAVPGVRIACAADGVTALRQFRSQPPDLMLMDVHMPGLNGVELCMHLRGTNLADETTIVTVSAAAGDDDKRLLRQLGVSAFFAKEPGGEPLFERMHRLVGNLYRTRVSMVKDTGDVAGK